MVTGFDQVRSIKLKRCSTEHFLILQSGRRSQFEVKPGGVCSKELDETFGVLSCTWASSGCFWCCITLAAQAVLAKESSSVLCGMIPLPQCSLICVRCCAQQLAGLGFAYEGGVRNCHG